ncbi:MAG: 23S rRNA (pseudouridine(1915)-N(3))-methyltransferase RlmH [Gemmatimonas sp.]|nr:23S rRNA (pseudouridine(1915)-N(3))-methyltransferase RlmH [Gemmatimonas sp.]
MKVTIVCVGRPRRTLAEAIETYEGRVARYFDFETAEVKESPGRGRAAEQVVRDEGERLLARVPPQHELIGLHRPGKAWSSEQLARHLAEAALRSAAGVSFVIGGAYGLSDEVLNRAGHLLSLSAMTLPHEMARLVLAEQIYRAGSINRGEPYHKGLA